MFLHAPPMLTWSVGHSIISTWTGTVNQHLRDALEQENDKDDWKMDLQGLERQFWLGMEAGRMGCYEFPGEIWAGDESAHTGGMGVGSVCLQQDRHFVVLVGRDEEGINSMRPETAAVARTLQAERSSAVQGA